MKTISFSMLVLIASPSLLFGQGFSGGDFAAVEHSSNKSESSYFAKPSSINASANHLKHRFLENTISSNEFSDEVTAPRVAPIVQPSTRVSMQGLKPKADLLDLDQPAEPKRFVGPSTRVRFSQLAPTPLEVAPKKVAAVPAKAKQHPVELLPRLTTKEEASSEDRSSAKIAVTEPLISGGDFRVPKRTQRVSVAPYMASEPSEFKLKMATSMQPILPAKPATPAKPASETAWGDIEVAAPPAAQEIINDIDRPIPESGNDFRPAEIVNESTSDSQAFEPFEPPRDEVLVMPATPEPAPVDGLDVFRRVQPWEQQASTMRHVTDHFSPGGEPFAQRTHQNGNPNVFGVDRRASCDEWNGFGNCAGLKQNPGHLGLPWLKSKEACEQSAPCRSCKLKKACQCEQCEQCQQCDTCNR